MSADSELDLNSEDLYDLELENEEVELGLENILEVGVRSLVLLLVFIGSLFLIILTKRRKPGIWNLAIIFTLIQIIWQTLAWFSASIDGNFLHLLKCPEVDCLNRRIIFKFCEHLFHGLAVYTSVVLVAKLEGLAGFVMGILYVMSAVAPLIYALIILLLDFTLDTKERFETTVVVGVSVFGGIWLNLIPAGLLLSWIFGKLVSGYRQVRTSSQRQTASHFIAILLILFHCVHFSKAIVYVISKASDSTDTQIVLASPILWLNVTGYILAMVAIPWAWVAGLLIPRRDATADLTEMNLKLAKQNKGRNIVKYRKEQKSVETPPQTPYKFQPEVTSSPSATSQTNSTHQTITNNGQEIDGSRSKRSSYIEAMSTGSFQELPHVHLQVNKARSDDPLWLTPTHLEQRV